MTALSPDQVDKLRVPDGFWLEQYEAVNWWHWESSIDVEESSHRDKNMANIVVAVANGHIPPAVLDVAWAIVEGRARGVALDEADRFQRGWARCDVVMDSAKPTHLLIELERT